MKKIMDWMANSFAPKMNIVARNAWVSSIQESILATMPLILIGSFAVLLSLLGEIPGFYAWFPDLSLITSFSFGLMALILSYLIPSSVMEKKKNRKTAKQAGMVGIALFLLLIYPLYNDFAWMFEYGTYGTEALSVFLGRFGTEGMLAAIIAGLFVGFVMNIFSKFSFFKKDTSIPDFITVWFDTLIPMLIVIIVGWILTIQLEFSTFALINMAFEPFIAVAQSFWGFVLFNFLAFSFLYSFGISTWVLFPVMAAIVYPAIAANMAGTGEYIHTMETYNLFLIGGGGTTLALNIMMLRAKSKRLKVIGRSCIVPSVTNINEPLVFGAPVAFNPLLMVPMWIMGLIGPAVVYLALYLRMAPIPSEIFAFWYFPSPIAGGIITRGISGVILVLAVFAISFIVYYPFFKVYDNQEAAKEKEEHEKKAAAQTA
jgi:PTS system cellobiose-specific IIC component